MAKADSCRIGVLCGGFSRERDVSLRSGENVYQALQSAGYDCVKIDIGRNAAEQITAAAIDVAYIALHGKWGEDGCVQGMLEVLGIPYTGSGVLASAIGMNKTATKRMLTAAKILTPEFFVIEREGWEARCRLAIPEIGFPMVIKPSEEGSSIAISIVKDEQQLFASADAMLRDYDEIFVERFVRGKEITTGVLGQGPTAEALPVLGLVSANEFYDYEAKYTKGMTEFVLPAQLEPAIYTKAQQLAVRVHNLIGCRGVSRVDAIVDDQDRVWVIEINTLPGMTSTSDLPAQAECAGISFIALIERIVGYALNGCS